jgi:type I restriction enzyme S subunit
MSSKKKFSPVLGVESALVPRLRFPEFRDARGWKETSLQKLARPVADRATTGDADSVLSLSGEHGLVLQSDYFGKKIAGDSTARYLKILKNDFVYNDRTTKASSFGTIKRLSKFAGGIVSPIYKCFRFQPSENAAFWGWYFESGSHDPALGGLVNEGARAGRFNISVTQFLSTNAWRPEEPEQKRIAKCMDSVDALIAAQGQKVEVLRVHKKGLMHQLLPQEGETKPRLRFPEFKGAKDWKTERVDQRGDVLAGKALAVGAPGPLRPYLRTKNVLDGAIDLTDVLTMPMTDAEFNRFEILDGDVLLNEGQSLELVGRTAIYRSEFGRRCAIQNQLLRFRSYPSTHPEFAAQVFRKCQKDGTFANVATKTTSIAHLGSSRFSSLRLAWPPSFAEQQRIANCLTSLDDLIAAETRKLDTLKIHKRGLMQQLFPRVGEVDA